jgi:hypothetical protein
MLNNLNIELYRGNTINTIQVYSDEHSYFGLVGNATHINNTNSKIPYPLALIVAAIDLDSSSYFIIHEDGKSPNQNVKIHQALAFLIIRPIFLLPNFHQLGQSIFRCVTLAYTAQTKSSLFILAFEYTPANILTIKPILITGLEDMAQK